MPDPDGPPTAPALDHLSLPVADLERSLNFYVSVMGMRLLWREPGMALVRAGDRSDLALNQAREALDAGAHAIHFGFKVASATDVDRWADYLERRGISDLQLEHGHDAAQLYFRDPDGYRLEIYYPGH